jgi:hypothetical protein
MKVLERFAFSAKGPLNEDLIEETPHYFGIFDGVSGVRADWRGEGRTMGQWGAGLAAEALRELAPGASISDYAALATAKIAAAKKKFDLTPSDRLAAAAIILPQRSPLEVWIIGDSHFGYRAKNGEWVSCPQSKLYDEVTLAYRQILIKQEMLERGMPQTQGERAAIVQASRNDINAALGKQMLLGNHPDPTEKLGFGVLTGTPVPVHHMHVHPLPEGVTEVALCSDGFPEASPTAAEARALLEQLKAEDPFLIGHNARGFTAHKGGFVQPDGSIGDCYDDISYIRVAV